MANLVMQHFVQGIPRSDGWFQCNSGQVICHDDGYDDEEEEEEEEEDWDGKGDLDDVDDDDNGDSSGSGQV